MLKKIAFICVLVCAAAGLRAQFAPTAGNLQTFVVVTQGNFSTAYKNVPYNGSASCLGGTLPCTYAVSSGSLPTGITQTSTGSASFSGTPTGSGLSGFCIQATDSATPVAHVSAPYCPGITVNTLSAIVVTPVGQTIATGTTGYQMQATGAWSNSCGTSGTAACPNLNTLATWAPTSFGTGGGVGLHTGILTAGSTASTPSITAAFNGVTSAGDTVTITSTAPNPTVSTSSLPNCHAAYAYNATPIGGTLPNTTVTASGGSGGPYTFAYGTGSFTGAGLTLNANGSITGTCSGTTQTATVIATDSAMNHSAAQSLTVTMEAETSTTVALAPTSVNVGGTSQATATAHYSGDSTAFIIPNGSGIGSVVVFPPGYSASATAIDVPITGFPAGALQGVCLYSGNGNTTTFTITNTPTQAVTLLGDNGLFTDAQNFGYAPSSAVITNVHVAASGTANQLGAIVFAIPGIATSTPLDGSTPAGTGLSVASLTTGALTTTNANDALVNCQVVGADQTSFTPGTGFAIPSNGTATRLALSSQTVSAIQTALTTSMSWLPTTHPAGSIFAAFKAAAGTLGAAFTSGTGCTVNGAGSVTTQTAGTCSVTATFQGHAGSATLTINQPTDTSLTGSCPPGVLVGVSGQCTITGEPSGTSYTSSATWQSSAPSILKSNGGGSISGVANGSATMSAQTSFASWTSPLVTVSTQGTASLLPGCTYTGTGGCAVPGGWTLVAQQDFECGGASHASPANPAPCPGTLPSNQAGFNTSQGPNVFEQVQAHTGSSGYGGRYASSTDIVGWSLNQGVTGTFTSIYISWWEYTDPNALYPTSDYFMGGISGTVQCGGAGTGNGWNHQNPGVSVAQAVSDDVTGGNGTDAGNNCQGQIIYPGGGKDNIGAGTWRQVEELWTPNTTYSGTQFDINGPTGVPCASPAPAGCGNGRALQYINGVLIGDQENVNLVGSISMTNAGVTVGSVMTAFCPDGSYDLNFGVQCPSTLLTPFHRYFDDIIILKQ